MVSGPSSVKGITIYFTVCSSSKRDVTCKLKHGTLNNNHYNRGTSAMLEFLIKFVGCFAIKCNHSIPIFFVHDVHAK